MTEKQLEKLNSLDGGSCRDLTFSALTDQQAKSLVFWLCEIYPETEVNAYSSIDSAEIEPTMFFGSKFHSMHISAKSSVSVVQRLQLFLFREKDGSFFSELTFFPEDVLTKGNLLQMINNWLDGIVEKVKPTEYYLRFENASWTFGEVSEYSGVILYENDKLHTTKPKLH